MKKRVLSGIRATGRLHLGNYLGAVRGMLELQNNAEYETLYCVVDLHAITTPYDNKTLPQNTRSVILDYLACGIDPKKSILYVQSDLADLITQLAFYFSTTITVASMQHLPTFKEKVKQYPQHTTMALLNYPILMAADILIYKASMIPVGIDQEPHLEVAREIARKMNQLYGTDFPEPVRFRTKGEYIQSLTGEGKMSKSVEGSYINITDDLEVIKKKIAKVPTDSGMLGGPIPQVGGVASLFSLAYMFGGAELHQKYVQSYKDKTIRYSDMKSDVSDTIYKELQPIQEKRKYYEENPQEVDAIIASGKEKAAEIARETVRDVKEKMGLG
jgi:tryptophanyl-tRNA synthetase